MSSCSMCGSEIPDGQGVCSMCYGDVGYGSDGYYERWCEEQAAKQAEEAAWVSLQEGGQEE